MKNRSNITIILVLIVVIAGIVGFRMIRSYNTPNNANATYVTPSSTPTKPVNSITPNSTVASAIPTNRNTIEFGTRLLINNIWGAPPEEKLSSGIFLNEDNTFGWYWDRPDPLMKPGINGYQPLYPNVKIGGDIFEKPRHPLLPVKVSAIDQLNFYVDYDYLTEPTEVYNLAYQMYLTDTDSPPPDAVPKIEVMIWIHQTFGQPPHTYKGIYENSNNSYDLYSWVRYDSMIYSAYLMKGDPVFKAQHTVDAKKFLEDLNIDPNWYLFSIHLGSEVVSGEGKIQINKLEIIMNGQGL